MDEYTGGIVMTILLIVAGILLSSVPVVLAYIRFRNLKDEAAYKDLMTKAMIVGLLSCPAGFLLSGVFAIRLNLLLIVLSGGITKKPILSNSIALHPSCEINISICYPPLFK